MPIVVVFLVAAGIVSVEQLRGNRGYVIVAIAIIAAVLSPGYDASTQLAMAIPMLVLYEAGILASRLLPHLRAAPETQEE